MYSYQHFSVYLKDVKIIKMRRRFIDTRKIINGFIFVNEQFFPSGTYNWQVPQGVNSVDLFMVGGGGSGGYLTGGGSGFTKTYKNSDEGYRDGEAIPVTPGNIIPIVVGEGGLGISISQTRYYGENGTISSFNSQYIAQGGYSGNADDDPNKNGRTFFGGTGGSGGGGRGHYNQDDVVIPNGGSNGQNGQGSEYGLGQGHTTCDFGEENTFTNAGGGGGDANISFNYEGSTGIVPGGISDYQEGMGSSGSQFNYNTGGSGGGGYGGGGGASGGVDNYGNYRAGDGGDGIVRIRYKQYVQLEPIPFIPMDGTFYFQTDIKASSVSQNIIEVGLSINVVDNTFPIFGGRNSDNGWGLWSISGKYRYDIGKQSINSPVPEGEHIVKCNANGFDIIQNGQDVSNNFPSAGNTTSPNVILIGGNYTSGQIDPRKMVGDIYYFSVYNNGDLIRKYMPYKFGDKYFMYDAVTQAILRPMN